MNAHDAASAAADAVRGTDGRRLGPVARATRSTLLDALDALLLGTAWRQARVTEVADLADTSPAAFYQYFTDIEDAARQLLADRRKRRKRISKHLRLVAALLEFEHTLAGDR